VAKNLSRRFAGVDGAGDFFLAAVGGDGEVIGRLEVESELGCGVKVTCEAKGGIGRDAAAAVDDFRHARGRQAEFDGEAVYAQAEGLELVLQDGGAGVRERDAASGSP
jgi:hypothetical protein